MLTALLSILVVFAGVGLLLYLVSLLFNAFSLPLDGVWERWRIARCVARGRRGDALREAGDVDGALREFRAAFFLYPVRNRTAASVVVNHHTGLLSRLIALTEDVQGGTVRLFSLAKVDRLLNERSELQRRYFNARGAPNRQRRRQLDHDLDQNRRELQAALRQMIVEIRASRQPARLQ